VPTSFNNPISIKNRDPILDLEQELRLRSFNLRTIESCLYYNKKLLRFANCFTYEVRAGLIKDYLGFLDFREPSGASKDPTIKTFSP
jgi:hypothetical protein